MDNLNESKPWVFATMILSVLLILPANADDKGVLNDNAEKSTVQALDSNDGNKTRMRVVPLSEQEMQKAILARIKFINENPQEAHLQPNVTATTEPTVTWTQLLHPDKDEF